MVVTTITYLNMTTITVIAKDIQASLIRERKKLDDARNAHQSSLPSATTTTTGPTPKKLADIIKWPTSTSVGDRIKKMWNEDIERSVKRMQNTDWEKVGRAVEGHVERARKRIYSSFDRMGEDSKKDST